jgi:hypothetical protein
VTRSPLGALRSRRGIASVLAMMFLVMFSSLAVAMAVASQGNLRTASTHLHVLRAMGAAETGMAVAERRLTDAVARFVIERGRVDESLGRRLWDGSYGAGDGIVNIRPSADGRPDVSQTRSIADALVNSHMTDANLVTVTGFPFQADIFTPSGDIDTDELGADNWVRTGLTGIDASVADEGAKPAAYQITYIPLANGTDVRVIVTGYSSIGTTGSTYGYRAAAGSQQSRPVTRTIQQDYRIVKRPAHAMLSPSRIMIGKNVMINGNLGARYDDVDQNNGHPITMRSDFFGLDPALDARLDRLFQALAAGDVDGDNRLRVGHAAESAAIPSGSEDLDGDGQPDNAFDDVTSDGFVDEFDVFIKFYDANGDGKVTLSAALTAGTPAQGSASEFTGDDDLALLMDSAYPDRNRNGVSGFIDSNNNGRWDPGETILDVDPRNGSFADRVLGWRDGVIDRKDQYAKLRGRLVFRSTESAWAAANDGSYDDLLRGPMRPLNRGESATEFGADDDELPAITADSFTNSANPLRAAADGQPFASQVATQLGIGPGQLATYTEANTDATQPRFWRSDLDDTYVFGRTGRHIYEKMPFNSPAYADYYYRPRYENMTFRDVEIPMGTNALFINCTFVGVTYVRSYTDNSHANWSNYGKLTWSTADNRPVASTDPLDKSDFLRYTTGQITDGPANYEEFPDPPVINGVTVTGAARNTKAYSNNIRFHDCLFVGSLISDTPQQYTHIRNKFQFTGGTRFSNEHPEEPDDPQLNPEADDLEHIETTSLMAPNYSVDIGSFNSPTDTFQGGPAGQNVQLSGTIVAGVLDARGNTTIDGALMLTFAPVLGEGPLQFMGQAVGNPADFNSTLGYFGPEDGDQESIDPESLPIVNGQRIVGYDTDGDGIADVPHDQPRPNGAVDVPFYGYGRISINWNPNLPMPDGVLLPLSTIPLNMTYREGRQ